MAAIYFRNKNGKFVELPSGGVSDSQIEESVKKYLEENPVEFTETDPTVPDWAKQPNKPTYTADEVGACSVKDMTLKLAQKIDFSEALETFAQKMDVYFKPEADRKITDVYETLSKECNDLFVTKKSFGEQLNGINGEIDNLYKEIGKIDDYIKTEVDNLIGDIEETLEEHGQELSKKMEETVLYEEVVNTLEWTNQPTYEGTLDSAFKTDDFYYVTLKDASGNDLPDNQFMLKEFYAEGATVYSTVFTLADRKTGSGTLIEDYPVEFTQIGATVKMRDAGVWEVAYNPSEWKLNGNHGSLRFVCDGQFIQRISSAYFISNFQTDKNVSHYHSVNTTSYQTDSDSKNMGIYVKLNDGKTYKTNKFYNEMTITRISDTRYKTQRTVTLRYINFVDGTPNVISGNEFGHGEMQQGDTFLKKMNVQVAAVANRGFIRNGSVIRVTEVK